MLFFPYYIFPSATQVSSSSFFHVVHLLPAAPLVGLQVGPLGLEHWGRSRFSAQLLTQAPGSCMLSNRLPDLGDPAAQSLLRQASEGPLLPDSCRDSLGPRNPWNNSRPSWRKATCC